MEKEKYNLHDSDPSVFLAQEVIKIKTGLEKEIADLKKEVESVNKNSEKHHNDMEEIKSMLREALT